MKRKKKSTKVAAIQSAALGRRASSASTDTLEPSWQIVISSFAAHWRNILLNRNDLAKERSKFFFARSASARERLARDFYGPEHTQKMASLSPPEIRELLSPWLEHAIQYWLNEYEEIGDPDGDNFLAELPTAEYVSIVYLHHSFAGNILIDRYPGERVLYDDLYERMLSGFSSGGILRIYKSTGECFTRSEARSARAGIKQDLLQGIASAGDEDRWAFDMEAEGYWQSTGFESEDLDRVMIVEVNNYDEDRQWQEDKKSYLDFKNKLME